MREILFRGKTKNRKDVEWIKGTLVRGVSIFDDGPVFFIFDIDTEIHGRGSIDDYFGEEVVPETVGQFSGLFDENGIAIFEGDIVEFEGHGYMPFTERGVVVFQEGSFIILYDNEYIHRIGQISNWSEMGASGKVIYTYKIVGNIHDNPELLEVAR